MFLPRPVQCTGNTSSTTTRDSEYSTYAFNELCEVEIYGAEYKFSNSNVQMWSHCVQHLFHRVVFSSVDIQESTCLEHLKSLGPIDRKFHGHGKTMDLSCMNILLNNAYFQI